MCIEIQDRTEVHAILHTPDIGFHRTAPDSYGHKIQSMYCYLIFFWMIADVTGRGSGADNRSRTYDLRITNALLYQLSYIGIEPGLRGKPEVR
jgi:hypothetical protein